MRKSSDSNLLLGLILLSISGVPVLAGIGSALGVAAVFAGVLIFATAEYIFLALLAYGLWRFLRWYVPQVRQEYRRLTAHKVHSTPLARQVSNSEMAKPHADPRG